MVRTGDKVIVVGEDSTIYTVADARRQTRNRVVLSHPAGWNTRRSVYNCRPLTVAEEAMVSAVNLMTAGLA